MKISRLKTLARDFQKTILAAMSLLEWIILTMMWNNQRLIGTIIIKGKDRFSIRPSGI
jgi:hypothetical protein